MHARTLEEIVGHVGLFSEKVGGVFDVTSEAGESIACELWRMRLEKYVEGDQPPCFLCGVIWRMEQLYDFPDWLGEMYDACDWSDVRSTRSEFPWVEEEAKRLLSTEMKPRARRQK